MFDRIRSRFSEYWPHDDSPGYTDYPEVDIAAHRSNARLARLIGLAGFGMGLFAAYQTGNSTYIFGGLAWGALSLWAADNLRLQALEWEVQLLKERDRDE